jgi:hypothetical protein
MLYLKIVKNMLPQLSKFNEKIKLTKKIIIQPIIDYINLCFSSPSNLIYISHQYITL